MVFYTCDCYKSDVLQSEDKKSIFNWVDPKDKSGEFKRQQSTFRDWISSEEGAPFPAEKDRYHLCGRYIRWQFE